jgi:hypothetical protein
MPHNMIFSDHGGSCCGRRHLWNMNGATAADITAILEANEMDEDGRLVEVVISEENGNFEQLQANLVEAGFKLACTFVNDNGGNTCYVYFYHCNGFELFGNVVAPAPAPLRIEVPGPVQYRDRPAEPAPAPRIVHTSYHNVFARSGRSESGWPTRELAAAATVNARSIDRRDVYASGQVRWHVGV